MEKELNFAKDVALAAGKVMLKYFQVGMESHDKEDGSIVSVADEEINQFVINEVAKYYPEHSVQGEEGSTDKHSRYVWVCDPIDGTVPFVKGLPVSVFSLALVIDGKPVVGVVYDPFTDRLYSAAVGRGAFMNNSPLSVSNTSLGRHATIDAEVMAGSPYDFWIPCHDISLKTGTYILRSGSTINACCMVASGQYEACLFDGSKGKNMDIAAIKVIVEEAGGKVTDLFGQDQRYDQDIRGAIVSNGVVHREFVGIV